jgi:hypothetical protein
MRAPLTTRQRQVLEYIRKFMAKRGYPPTVREIGAYFDFVPGSVTDHLKALERKGYLRRDPAKSRTLQILAAPSARQSSPAHKLSAHAVESIRERPNQHHSKPAMTRGKKETVRSAALRRLESPKSLNDESWSDVASCDDCDSMVQEQLKLYSESRRLENATDLPRNGRSKSASLRSSGYQPLASRSEERRVGKECS